MAMQAAFARAGMTVLERGWLSSNNVLFAAAGAASAVLVDTGYASQAEQSVALVEHALRGRRLERIVNTHLHSDHCGGNAALQARFGCTVDVPAGDAAKVDLWDEAALGYPATGQQCPRFSRSGVVAHGDVLKLGDGQWDVIGTPGHDPESVVLHEAEQGLLISADALWENGFGVVFEALDDPAGFTAVRRTLERLSGLAVRWVVPGHGRPFGEPARAIERALRRLDLQVADPQRHARHAAKVLIKFHLLEVRSEELPELRRWFERTGLLGSIHGHNGGNPAFIAWCDGLLEELVAAGALQCRDGIVENT